MNDSFGRQIDYLRLSVTDRCNLRCVYCMPEDGVQLIPHLEVLTFEEIVRLARIMKPMGIRKVRVTGGEPLLRRGLPDLVRLLDGIGFEEIVLTTNGLMLPPVAGELREAGITRVNISLDSLQDEVLRAVTRSSAGVAAVEEAIRSARQAGLEPVRVNCVVLRGINDREIPDFIVWSEAEGVQVRFIEQMPAGVGASSFVPASEMLARAAVLGRVVEEQDGPGEIQRTFSIEGTGMGFGIIQPLSGLDFCARCRRIRLSARGILLTCLSREEGTDLRRLIRSGAGDEALSRAISEAVSEKPLRHDGCRGMKMWRTGG